MKHTTTIIISLIILLVYFYACEQTDPLVMLEFKYSPGHKIENKMNYAKYVEEYKNDSLVNLKEILVSGITVEEVIKIYDSSIVIKHTKSYTTKTLNPEDNTYSTSDTSYVEFSLQTFDGRIIGLMDTTGIETGEIEARSHEFTEMSPRYPSVPIPVGYTWTQNIKMELDDGSINSSENHIKFHSLARMNGYDCAIVKIEREMDYPIDKYYEERGIRLYGDYKGHLKSVTYHALDEGFIVNYSHNLENEGKLIEDKDGIKSDIIVKVKTKLTYSLLEYNDIAK